MKCDELKWKWAYGPYLDPPEGQKESAIKAGYVKVVSKQSADEAIAELKARIQLDDDEMAGFLDLEEECGGGDLRNYIAELKAKLEEKDKEIARLNDKALQYKVLDKEHCRDLNTQERLFALQIAHHKYKRCLAMAAVCFEKSYSTTLVKYDKESGLLRNFYDWWGKRWLKLAEKFKEAK